MWEEGLRWGQMTAAVRLLTGLYSTEAKVRGQVWVWDEGLRWWRYYTGEGLQTEVCRPRSAAKFGCGTECWTRQVPFGHWGVGGGGGLVGCSRLSGTGELRARVFGRCRGPDPSRPPSQYERDCLPKKSTLWTTRRMEDERRRTIGGFIKHFLGRERED